jgi:hypothetical protein
VETGRVNALISSGAVGTSDDVDSDTRTSGHVRDWIGNTIDVLPVVPPRLALFIRSFIVFIPPYSFLQRSLPRAPHPAMATLNKQLVTLTENYTACDVCPT